MDERRVPGRPRPVADPVLAAVAERPDEVARRWLLALMEATPLEAAAAVPVDALSQDGPAFCAAVLRAVGSDEALAALAAPGPSSPAAELTRLSGAGDGPAAVAAAESLRRAIREAAAVEVSYADSAVLADLGDRLAHVCAHLAATAMAAPATERRVAPPPAPRAAPEPPPEEEGGEEAAEPAAAESAVAEAPPADVDATGAAPLWLAALERQVAGGGRFGLLLIELDDAERLRLAEGPEAARELFARAARAVRGCVRRGDVLAHEEDGRIWLIAGDSPRTGSTALAGRVAQAVEAAVSARGVPLTVSIGIALYPDDGRTGEELMGQAEEGAFAARAEGVRVAGEPDEPAASGPRLVP